MKSSIPKIMHKLAGTTLLEHVIATAQNLSPLNMAVVCGNGADQVLPLLEERNITSVMQHEQLGTGHAVMQAETAFANADQVLVLYG
ncbi:MAG: NTP transferase domain-containing protein, partial [Methylophagaceae bacterium]